MRTLNVYLYNDLVGQITLLPGNNTLFTFEDSYLNDTQRPTLSQSFISSSKQILLNTKPTRTRLAPFFSNLLPEGHLRTYLANNNNINPKDEFSLISALGSDLPGAIHISTTEPKSFDEWDASYQGLDRDNDNHYRFSIAGIQLKFSAIVSRRGGLTIPASGVGGTWIIKLPSLNYVSVPENEFAMMSLAKKIGINVPECKLIEMQHIEGLPDLGILEGRNALAVKRFDRAANNSRIHMEDFAQVYSLFPEEKYEKVSYGNIANMIWTLCGENDFVEYIRRLVFSILIGNGDMHLKNWSFLYPDKKTPQLSPAYDLLSTVPYIPGDKLALTLHKTKDMQQCTYELFQSMAEKSKLPKNLLLETIKETSSATRDNWLDFKKNIDLDSKIIDQIDHHMDSIKL